jgi:hypothetical protein
MRKSTRDGMNDDEAAVLIGVLEPIVVLTLMADFALLARLLLW